MLEPRNPCSTPGAARDTSWEAIRTRSPTGPMRNPGMRAELRAKGSTVFNSVRVRITAWYTAVMALVLVLLSLFTYTIFWKTAVQQTDSELAELAAAFLVTFQDELQDTSQREPR